MSANKDSIVRKDDATKGNNNEKHANNRRKDKIYIEFSYEMKQLERKELVKSDPTVINKQT